MKTAVAVAKEAGILDDSWVKEDEDDCTVMTGAELRKLVGGIERRFDEYDAIIDIDNFKKVRDQLKVLALS